MQAARFSVPVCLSIPKELPAAGSLGSHEEGNIQKNMIINGVVNVKKEKGMTSFGVVARLRRIFGQKKIGHTGTLDPDAEGVLPVCFGRATHLVETLSRGTKEYEAVILLGRTTDTQDVSGTVLREADPTVSEEEIRQAILSFKGKQTQLPPMYSAVKVNGQKLVDLARKGIEIDRPTREVEFSEIEILWVDIPRAAFRVTCTHGTYIRTLCNDIGEKLGCGACMEALLRTRVGEFHLDTAMTIDEIAARKEAEGDIREYSFVRPIDAFYAKLPKVTVFGEVLTQVLNGNGFSVEESDGASELSKGQEARVYTSDGDFIGIFQRKAAGMRLVKYFYEAPGSQ